MVWWKRNVFWQILMLLWWKMAYDLPLSAEKQPAITWPMTTKSSSSWVSSAIWQRTDWKWSTAIDLQQGWWFGPKLHLQPSRANHWISCSSVASSSHLSMGTLSTCNWPQASPTLTISAAVCSSHTSSSSTSLGLLSTSGWSRVFSFSGRIKARFSYQVLWIYTR